MTSGSPDGASRAAAPSVSRSRSLIARFVRHPNAANLLMALLLLLGVFGILRINTQFFPTITTNNITVSVAWPGASSEDVSANILDVIEPEVRFLDNVDEVRSFAREGSASITIEFVESADMQKALSDVEQAISNITTLPEDSENPVVTRFEPFEQIARIAVRGPFSEAALKSYARTVRDALLDAGVDKVAFEGLRDTEFVVAVPPLDLRRLGLTVADVAGAIGGNSRDTPAGALDGSVERQVRTLAEAETPGSIGRIDVLSLPSGETVSVRDLAVVEERPDDADARGLSGGQPAIELIVQRAAAADTLEMAENMERGVEAARALLPDSVELLVYQVSSDRVAERIGLLVKNGATGLVVVVIVLFLFLNARVAIWVAAGVPVALFATIGIMFATGQTINMISLFALIMTLGIIVDDAIVVGEHTATRHADGEDPETAAINGAERMITPVVAAMATTVASFAPILLVTNVIGQIMSALPLVAVAVLVASLIECFFILPGHLGHALAAKRRRRASLLTSALIAMAPAALLVAVAASETFALSVSLGFLHTSLAEARATFGGAFDLVVGGAVFLLVHAVAMIVVRRRGRGTPGRGFRARFDRGFAWVRERIARPVATAAVRLPYLTVAGCAASLILAFGMLFGGRIPFEFFPSPEGENITAAITFQSGLPEAEAAAAIAEVEAALMRAERALGGEGPGAEQLVRASFVVLGKTGQATGDNLAEVRVELTSSEARSVRTPDIVRAWRAALPEIAGVKRVAISALRLGPPGRDLDIRLQGADVQQLKAASLAIQDALLAFPGVSGVDDDLPFGKPELELRLTATGRALGFTVEEVGRQIRDAIDGRIARRIPTVEEEIVVRVRQALDGSGGALRALELRAPNGDFVPLTEVVTITDRQGFSVIRRRDGVTTISVTADVDAERLTNVQIEEGLVGVNGDGPLPEIASRYGVTYEFSGRAEERSQAFADLQIGGLAALGAIYIILAGLFANYGRPFAVMLIIPFGAVGALLGHYVMGIPLTILSFIGLLGLTGILVNDSIILVARFVERLNGGEPFHDAAIGASCDRLRAILLTSFSTIGGLAPLLFETSLQAQFLMPMAVTIVFGIGASTVFVLFLTPALLAIGYDFQRLVGGDDDATGATAGRSGVARPAE